MSKRGRNSRKEPKRQLKPPKRNPKSQYEFEKASIYKKETKKVINKRYLILCEGETEDAYFTGLKNNILLKERFQAVQIQIIAPDNEQKAGPDKGLKDNSIKGMVWEAMKRQRKAKREKNPYDEIWIVFDNDEGNSYQITKSTIHRAKHLLNQSQFSKFSDCYDFFFLSKNHYDDFLKKELKFSPKIAAKIIGLTDKNSFFEDLENPDSKKQFYSDHKFTYGKHKKSPPDERDFDSKWQEWLLKAYSCRTFENWLILHFETCKTPFTISKEYPITIDTPIDPKNSIHYLWKFIPYAKGKSSKKTAKLDAYNCLKPQPFNLKYETEKEAQAVIDKVKTAILNSHWLREEMATELAAQNEVYYEVNPYIIVDSLILSLLDEQVMCGTLGRTIRFENIELTGLYNKSSNQFQVKITNHSTKRLLINKNNLSDFFRILIINASHVHEYINPISINETINIIPEDLQTVQRIIEFPPFSNNRVFLIFQNSKLNNYLYFPI